MYVYLYMHLCMRMYMYKKCWRARGVRFRVCTTTANTYFAILSKWHALPRSSRAMRVVCVG